MNDTAVIIGTYNRAHLLRRSLLHYPDDVDIFIIDDGSTDHTNYITHRYRNAFYYFLENKQIGWRDSSSYLNIAIKAALKKDYEYIFITHPEIIPGKTTIESAKQLATDKETWVSCKGYYLTPEQQEFLKDDAQVKTLPNFYKQTKSPEFTGNPNYVPEAIEAAEVWHSWIFGGGSRAMWKYFGGLTPFDVWGSIDIDLMNRRTIAGMKTVTPCKETDIVIHQNHDDPTLNTITPRNMELCMKAAPRYESKQQALKPELLR